jgi:hypothetical protein
LGWVTVLPSTYFNQIHGSSAGTTNPQNVATPPSSNTPAVASSSSTSSPSGYVPVPATPASNIQQSRPQSSSSSDRGSSPPSSRPITPNTARRGDFHVPVCLDNSELLRHSIVKIRTDQSEDDNMTFQNLRDAYYPKTKEFIQRLIFKPLVRIHRAKVLQPFVRGLTLSSEFIKIISSKRPESTKKTSAIIKNSVQRRLGGYFLIQNNAIVIR